MPQTPEFKFAIGASVTLRTKKKERLTGKTGEVVSHIYVDYSDDPIYRVKLEDGEQFSAYGYDLVAAE